MACLENDLELGSRAPYADGVQWLALDSTGELRDFAWNDGVADLVFRGVRLHFELEADEIVATWLEPDDR